MGGGKDLRLIYISRMEPRVSDLWLWPAFIVLIVVMLGIDLFFFRGEHEVTLKEALLWSLIWTIVGVGFVGVIYAIFFRAIFIGLGAGLLQAFSWMTFVFGAFLLFTAFKLLRSGDMHVDPAGNPAVKLLRRFFPVTSDYRGQSF